MRNRGSAVTYAPAELMRARSFLLAELDMHPGRSLSADLDPEEVGIVGDSAHRGGYHCGWDRRSTNDYSWTAARDAAHKTNAARGLDVGWFDVTRNGRRATLHTFNAWLIRQCVAGTPDTQDIREVIYTPDGRTVRRWDRLRRSTTGDSSHLTHTHISYFADAEYRSKTALFRRYIAEAFGGTTPTGDDDDMAFDDEARRWLEICVQVAAAQVVDADTISGIRWYGQDPQSYPNHLRNRLKQLADRPAGTVTFTDAQAAAFAAEVGEHLVAATDNPLGEADKPAIIAAIEEVLRRAAGTT